MKNKMTKISRTASKLVARQNHASHPCFHPGKALALGAVVGLVLGFSAAAATVSWNYTSGNRNWSTAGNWSPNAALSTMVTNNLIFDNVDAQTTNTPVNTVDASVTVSSLSYTNFYTNSAAYLSFQNTTVAGGQTLTITNGLNVGVGSDAGYGASPYTYVNLTGAGGTVAVTGGNVQVGYQSSSSATVYVFATLDMRGLDNFSFNNSAGTFGVAAYGGRRQGGEVYLGGTNSLVASAITLGNSQGGLGSNPAKLHLGNTNNLFADTITVGNIVSGCFINFETNWNNPMAKIRAHDGINGVGNWYIGYNNQPNQSSSTSLATNDFSGGMVNVMATNLYVGYISSTSTSTAKGSATGFFLLGTNQNNFLVVQNLFIGDANYPAGSGSTTATGTFSVSGGSVTATAVTLAQQVGLPAVGNLWLNTGAKMNVTGSVTNGAGTSTIALSGGATLNVGGSVTNLGGISTILVSNATLNVLGQIGSPTANLGTLYLSNATLGLTLAGLGAANAAASVGTLNVDGAAGSTLLTINNTNPVGQYSLIAYSSLGGATGFGGLQVQSPPGVTATLSNNVSGYPYTVDVVITAPSALMFTTPAFTSTAGIISGTITVQLQANGYPLNTTSNLTVNLSSSSATGLFRNLANTANISSVVIPAGSSSASFLYVDTAAPATPTLTASTTATPPAEQQETINPNAAAELGFTTQPANGFVNVTLSLITVQIEDAYGNPVPQSGTPVNLTLNGAMLAGGTTPQYTDVNGQAAFNDFLIAMPASGLTLTAAATGFPSVTSSNFSVTYGAIVKAYNQITMDQPSSWTGGVVPNQYDYAQIDNTSVSASSAHANTDLGASSTAWYGLLAYGWAANTGYTISNYLGNALTLGAGGITGSNLTHSLTFWPNVLLATNQAWIWGTSSEANGSLNLYGNIDNGGYNLTIGGSRPINVNGVISDAGNLIKQTSDTLTLAAANTYTGATTVSNGTLLVNGSLAAGGPVLVAGGILGGVGVIGSAVTVQSDGQLAPGTNGLGTLVINSNLTLNAGSSVLMAVDPILGMSGFVTGLSNVVYGGTLVVTNLEGALTNGSQFTLFGAVSATNNFASISGSPGAGLAWNFNPANGVLSVINGIAANPTNLTATVSSGVLTLTWPPDHLGWLVQSNSVNLAVPADWYDLSNTAAATFYSVPMNPTQTNVFYRLRHP